jgi:hypothetical protein
MALDSGFMAALMNIPYFKELVEQNGEEWLESVFDALETDSYDFSLFDPTIPDEVALSIDDAIELDLAELTIDTDDAATAADATVAAKKVATDEDDSEARNNAAQAAFAAEAKQSEVAEAAAQDADDDVRTIKFDNDDRKNEPTVPHNSEMIQRYLWQWVAMFNPDNSYSAHKSEEAVVVGLNGLYTDLKLSAFDDKIYTSSGKGDVNVNAGDGNDTLYLTTGGLKANLGGVSDFGNNGG